MEWSWEGPYKFVGYQDEQGFQECDKGREHLRLQVKDEQVWTDIQILQSAA